MAPTARNKQSSEKEVVLSWIGRFRLGLFLSICCHGALNRILENLLSWKSDFQEFFSFLFFVERSGVLQMWVRPKHFVNDCRFFMLQKWAGYLSCDKPLSFKSSHEKIFSYPSLISNIINKKIRSNPCSGADLGEGCRGCGGVEVEQETSAPPPKKNPGNAPVVQLFLSVVPSYLPTSLLRAPLRVRPPNFSATSHNLLLDPTTPTPPLLSFASVLRQDQS